ncbi:LysR family transcriptional regulator [Achromobacter sp. Marseille-Q0513]|uniref:LysR family transcriptional regulator n=1 Tax=Achromobacter sp. Marseille-Q0513 TaxID=2829161 RepID=UPI001B8DE3BC|nr:LysR family transcriptional regulator [Achromobacter sp. Marseille-Q0513]MBR8655846.1 LysR family transcriptional regulator [Achromobacter sp. Marseille-Q0513]
MSKDIDRLRDMAFFAEVAKAGSFTKASLAAGIPTSTLSRRISEFEADIGVKLFNRSTRRVSLTETGSRYLQQIDDIMQQARLVNDELDGETSNPSGVLRVGMSSDFAVYFADTHFAEFRERHPKISFEISMVSPQTDLATERNDLAIVIGDPPPNSRLIARRVTHVRRHLYATPAYLARHGAPAHPDQLADHACLFTAETDNGGGWLLKRGAESVLIQPKPLVATNSQSVIKLLVAQGQGIGLMGRTYANASLCAGRIERVLPEWELDPQPLHILSTSRLLPARARVFVDFLTQRLERTA